MIADSLPADMPTARDQLIAGAIRLVREKGFNATSVAAICNTAGLTKGGFFHHFTSKEALGVAAAAAWRAHAGTLFDTADYRFDADPVARVLGYIAHRAALIEGAPAEFCCYAGTLVQEVHQSSPALRTACQAAILGHGESLAADFDAALAARGVTGVTGLGLARHVQAVLQGGFIMAKAANDAGPAREAVAHLERYLKLLFNEGEAA